MRIKSQHNLQPTVTDAHSVILEDDFGNIIFVAVAASDNTIVTATAGDSNFKPLLEALGIDKVTIVHDVNPKPIDVVRTTF
ncbi:MAG: hypothetical protein EBV03_06410 [Proteobacteria bacterium]|nr:hypothetical protein [Pseudomonadota bacterium]